MAIQFARIEIVKRNEGGNACCKSAYNSRSRILDEKTGLVYDFRRIGGNVYHQLLLPEYVASKYRNLEYLANAIEHIEKKSNSQLLKDIVIALPNDAELELKDRIEITQRIIKNMGWVETGLGVQVDIHEPHDGQENWHAHLLVTTRRFDKSGERFASNKARDLNPEFKTGKYGSYIVPEEDIISRKMVGIINNYFEELGLPNRVDVAAEYSHEHVGPKRMRRVMNAAAERNELRKAAEVEYLSSGPQVIEKVSRQYSVFSSREIVGALKYIEDDDERQRLVEEAIGDPEVIKLYQADGEMSGYYTTKTIRAEEKQLMRLAGYVAKQPNRLLKKKGIGKWTGSLTSRVLGRGLGSKISQRISEELSERLGVKGRPTEYQEQLAELIEQAEEYLSSEQHQALSELLLQKQGLRILQGRAGTGKSHVLKQIASIVQAVGVKVVGVAPTHKAKLELARDGFKQVNTVKGLLFKNRYDSVHHKEQLLPRNSLLIVDEAGMVSNRDYQELLKLAAVRGCNVILAGDDRQLESVERGRLFSELINEYGSSQVLTIRRQDNEWGKEVSAAMWEGDVSRAVKILKASDKIRWNKTALDAKANLLADWQANKVDIADKIILAVSNKDVASLNHGVREYLKAEGKLTGMEVEVGGNYYQRGDQLLITETAKQLGLVNGDIGKLAYVSSNLFIIQVSKKKAIAVNSNDNDNRNIHRDGHKNGHQDIDENKEVQTRQIKFDPREYSGFRHGYATTIFKSQAATVQSVYMYHSGYGGLSSSYVGLSRNKSELLLYVSQEQTANESMLIKQLGRRASRGSSLGYMTSEELVAQQQVKELAKQTANDDGWVLQQVRRWVKVANGFVEELVDKYSLNNDYYHYSQNSSVGNSVGGVDKQVTVVNSSSSDNTESAAKVNNKFGIDGKGAIRSTTAAEESLKEAGSGQVESSKYHKGAANLSNPQRQGNASTATIGPSKAVTNKSKFYQQVDRTRARQLGKQQQQQLYQPRYEQRYNEQKRYWEEEYKYLKQLVQAQVEYIALRLLGKPNGRLSKQWELRFGKNGKLAVRLTGENAGKWHDFSTGQGGNMFELVMMERRLDFKDAAEYLRAEVGMMSSDSSYKFHQRQFEVRQENTEAAAKRKAEQKASELAMKQEREAKVEKLYKRSKPVDRQTEAYRYLQEQRKIDLDKAKLSADIRTAGVYCYEKQNYLKSLVVFARDPGGKVTGGQYVWLDQGGRKAAVAAPKRSFGRVSGSMVDLGVVGLLGVEAGSREYKANELSETNRLDKTFEVITILTEGVETGLSVKQGIAEYLQELEPELVIRVLCSLGINNLKNYQPTEGEKLIIAADNDGKPATNELRHTQEIQSRQVLVLAGQELETKGAKVEVVYPAEYGDFNDILQKGRGSELIGQYFKPAIERLAADQGLSKYEGDRYGDKDGSRMSRQLARVTGIIEQAASYGGVQVQTESYGNATRYAGKSNEAINDRNNGQFSSKLLQRAQQEQIKYQQMILSPVSKAVDELQRLSSRDGSKSRGVDSDNNIKANIQSRGQNQEQNKDQEGVSQIKSPVSRQLVSELATELADKTSKQKLEYMQQRLLSKAKEKIEPVLLGRVRAIINAKNEIELISAVVRQQHLHSKVHQYYQQAIIVLDKHNAKQRNNNNNYNRQNNNPYDNHHDLQVIKGGLGIDIPQQAHDPTDCNYGRMIRSSIRLGNECSELQLREALRSALVDNKLMSMASFKEQVKQAGGGIRIACRSALLAHRHQQLLSKQLQVKELVKHSQQARSMVEFNQSVTTTNELKKTTQLQATPATKTASPIKERSIEKDFSR